MAAEGHQTFFICEEFRKEKARTQKPFSREAPVALRLQKNKFSVEERFYIEAR
jgi:hypothetical protein